MPHTPISSTDLRALLVAIVAGATDEPEARWDALIGKIQRLSLAKHPRSNWAVTPAGTDAERDIITRAAEIVRGEHPYVDW